MKHRILPFIALIALWGGCQSEPNPAPELPSIPFRDDGSLVFERDGEPLLVIAIEIADNDSSRTRGMMQRTSLPEKSGMLFVFEQEEPRSFWMANTVMALDLLFVTSDGHIVTIQKYARPLSPDPVVSMAAARFVVEVPAGFVDNHGLIEGDRISWERR